MDSYLWIFVRRLIMHQGGVFCKADCAMWMPFVRVYGLRAGYIR